MELNVDKNNYILSKRYASALIELSDDNALLETFCDDLLNVLEKCKSSQSLKDIMMLPSVEKNRKKEVLKEVFEKKINDIILKFLYVLVDSNRFDHLETIIYCFKQEKDKINNIVSAHVTSAIEFGEEAKKNLEKILAKKTNKKVNIEYETDSDIIGGFILTLGEYVVDLSLKNKIINMKKQLI